MHFRARRGGVQPCSMRGKTIPTHHVYSSPSMLFSRPHDKEEALGVMKSFAWCKMGAALIVVNGDMTTKGRYDEGVATGEIMDGDSIETLHKMYKQGMSALSPTTARANRRCLSP